MSAGDLNLQSLYLRGTLSPSAGFVVDTTGFFGIGTSIPSGLPYNNMEIDGTPSSGTQATLSGDLSITGNLEIFGLNSADLILNGNRLDMAGNFEINGVGVLTMTNAGDTLAIGGNALFAGASTDGLLTTGTLTAGGDFTQSSTTSLSSFLPTGTNVVELDGTAAQVVDFATPTSSTFNNLTLRNASVSGVSLTSNILVRQLLSTPDGATKRNVFGAGNTVTTRSVSISNMTRDAAPLVVEFVTGLSGTTKLDTLTFQNYATTDVVLTVIRQSGPPVFWANDFSALATPTGAGAWIWLRDDDGATNGLFDAVFVLALPDPPPWSGTLTPWIVEENGALLSCWGFGCF